MAVDRVSITLFLSNFVKQPRGGSATQNCGAHGEWKILRTGAGDAEEANVYVRLHRPRPIHQREASFGGRYGRRGGVGGRSCGPIAELTEQHIHWIRSRRSGAQSNTFPIVWRPYVCQD